ncbi:MAG: DNA-binding response regulator [Chloroflexi bacterium RBG_13_68_17]|jgi:DNA-binding response OmpR family regulator|nr:MAG: DNA-binding response regulator [Chloroflexi bacterium RBG_13_68_17]
MTTLLLVEDDRTVRETLALNLRAEGYQVETAEDGEAGLRLARQIDADLVVLDVMLPKLDGLTVCRLLRKESDVPIILLTARGTETDKIIGLETGADDYVTKPFSLGEFLARVRAALRRGRSTGAPAAELTSGDLRLDLIAHRAFHGAEEIQLAPREFDLLATLMRNRGAVLTRDLLLAQVWGDDFPGDDRTVDVHIRWLRQKIEPDPSAPARITTVRGMGYRFEG